MLAGTPAFSFYASVMIGLATTTLSTSSVRAEETGIRQQTPPISNQIVDCNGFRTFDKGVQTESFASAMDF